mmetsp:Transcript_6030/g.15835  ORF Transcript_6030/g.15835 Transcript_6030/m.15835 type:complete len:94 (-) Transcript_6030:632-913(-)
MCWNLDEDEVAWCQGNLRKQTGQQRELGTHGDASALIGVGDVGQVLTAMTRHNASRADRSCRSTQGMVVASAAARVPTTALFMPCRVCRWWSG